MEDKIHGAEGIVIHGDKIVLGMQKPKRWYHLENGEKAALVKTLGGAVEEIDEKSTRKALIREVLEEVKGIEEKDIKVSQYPIFTKEIKMGELNPYEQNSNLKMKADFYIVEIPEHVKLVPNDLPALIEIPKDHFYKMNFASNLFYKDIRNFVTKSKEEVTIPENCAIMAPKEIKNFLKSRQEEEK